MLVYKSGSLISIVWYVFIVLISVLYSPYHPLNSSVAHACRNTYVTRFPVCLLWSATFQ